MSRPVVDAIRHGASWCESYRASQWVRHESGDAGAEAALSSFKRLPRWMWRNRGAEQNARLVRNAELYYAQCSVDASSQGISAIRT